MCRRATAAVGGERMGMGCRKHRHKHTMPATSPKVVFVVRQVLHSPVGLAAAGAHRAGSGGRAAAAAGSGGGGGRDQAVPGGGCLQEEVFSINVSTPGRRVAEQSEGTNGGRLGFAGHGSSRPPGGCDLSGASDLQCRGCWPGRGGAPVQEPWWGASLGADGSHQRFRQTAGFCNR